MNGLAVMPNFCAIREFASSIAKRRDRATLRQGRRDCQAAWRFQGAVQSSRYRNRSQNLRSNFELWTKLWRSGS